MKIGITGASGHLGTALVRHALARTSAGNIVAITRNPGKLEQFSQQGIEVRAGDFSQPSALAAAFRDIERLVIIPTTELQAGVRIQQHKAAIEAAAGRRVQHLIYISTVSPRPDPNNSLLDSHFATEQALIASGVDWTILRMSVYADSLLDAAKRAAASGSYAAVPGAPAAYVVRDDLAAAAAGILCTPGHVGITYHATGPASVTQPEIADAVAKATGKPIPFLAISKEQQRAGLEAAGLPPAVVNTILGFQAALRAGAFDLVTGDVARLSGKLPESSLQFLVRALGSAAHA
jgi:NAD(P)H dehydrogenase (quinone)